jgi:hypothetical protein
MNTLFNGQSGRVIIWVPSGGTNPDGTPTIASQLRIRRAESILMRYRNQKCTRALLLFSGAETLNCGSGAQGPKLATWFRENLEKLHKDDIIASPLGFAEVIAIHGNELAAQANVVLVHDDWYMSFVLWQLARQHPALASTVTPELVQVLTDAEYRERYGMDYIGAYNAAAWLKAALGVVGPWQFFWFCLNQLMGKPSQNPVKRALRWLTDRFLRKDLTGK